MYVVRHKNCLPAVKCRNGLSETFPIFKNHLGICSDVSGLFPCHFPWDLSLGTAMKDPSFPGGGADKGRVPFPQLRGGWDGLLRHGAGWGAAEIPGPHPCAGGGAEGWAANWGLQVRKRALWPHYFNYLEAESTPSTENMQQQCNERPEIFLKKLIVEGLLKCKVLCPTAAYRCPWCVLSGMTGTKGQSKPALTCLPAKDSLFIGDWQEEQSWGLQGCWVVPLVHPEESFVFSKSGSSSLMLHYHYIPSLSGLSTVICYFGL